MQVQLLGHHGSDQHVDGVGVAMLSCQVQHGAPDAVLDCQVRRHLNQLSDHLQRAPLSEAARTRGANPQSGCRGKENPVCRGACMVHQAAHQWLQRLQDIMTY